MENSALFQRTERTSMCLCVRVYPRQEGNPEQFAPATHRFLHPGMTAFGIMAVLRKRAGMLCYRMYQRSEGPTNCVKMSNGYFVSLSEVSSSMKARRMVVRSRKLLLANSTFSTMLVRSSIYDQFRNTKNKS